MNKTAHTAVLTLWFISAPEPHPLLATQPTSDTLYAFDLVNGLFPDKPITPLGSFPLTRSVPAGKEEIYVGSYPGITILQTSAVPITTMEDLVPQWVQPSAAPDIYAFAQGSGGNFAAFAHWHKGKLQRALTATATDLIETVGLPDPAEGPYWAGEFPNEDYDAGDDVRFTAPLPFRPADMLLTMHTRWLGFSPNATHLDLDVAGYALDGRPQPQPPHRSTRYDDLPENDAEDDSSSVFALGNGASAEDLTAAEMEEASGQMTTAEDLLPASSRSSYKDKKSGGLWKRMKSWWSGDESSSEGYPAASEDYADDEDVEDNHYDQSSHPYNYSYDANDESDRYDDDHYDSEDGYRSNENDEQDSHYEGYQQYAYSDYDNADYEQSTYDSSQYQTMAYDSAYSDYPAPPAPASGYHTTDEDYDGPYGSYTSRNRS